MLLHKKHLLSQVSDDRKNIKGQLKSQTREVYNRGNGAAIFLHDQERGTVIPTRQFRLSAYFNGNQQGKMIGSLCGAAG